jgi:Fic-DOC domain mobile mystery protein B
MAIELEYPEWSTPLETEELDELIPGHITTQGQLNEWEALNIAKWLTWAYASRWDMLTEAFCKKLHRAMFDETWKWAGEFRRTNKNIWCDWHLVGIELRKTLDDVRYWMENKTFPIHEIALRAHHKLVYVHPFPNGNGRFCRAMADVLVARAGKPPLLWNDFWNLVDQADVRKRYIESLRKADNGDYSALIDLCSPLQ